VQGRDEAEEVEQFCSAGTAEFPGIVDSGSFWNPEHQTDRWQGGKLDRGRVSSGATAGLAEDKAEDTGAGSEKHRGTLRAEIPDQMVMGLQDA
jgi:hypothetical protein